MAPREGRIKKQNELLALYPEVKEELMKIPGVESVAVGLKLVNNELTDEIVFQVFVGKKLEEHELETNAIIPKEIRGIKTDVQLVHRGAVLRGYFDPGIKGDEREYRPLKAGIKVGYGIGGGTLGCFGRLVKGNGLVIVTNHHVIAQDRPEGALVGQPLYNRRCCCCCGYDELRIGKLLKKGVINEKVDVALALVDEGIGHEVIIHNSKSDPISLRIEGTAKAVSGDPVFKIGRISGYTEGIIMTINGEVPAGEVQEKKMVNQIFIKPAPGEKFQESTNNKKAFSDGGDSGSVILNEKHEIVALLFGGNPDINKDFDVTYASQIEDVLEALKNDDLEIIIEKSPPKSATILHAPEGKIVDKPVRHDLALKEKLAEHEQGRLWLNIFEKHHQEILHLVNHDRQVTVTWQRNQGPAFMAHLVKSAQEPLYIVPDTVESISLQYLLIKMIAILKVKGSETLRDDIEKYGLELIGLSIGLHSVSELYNKLRAEFKEQIS